MAKFKSNYDFEGYKEKKTFEADKEFEMTIKRAEEVESKIKKIEGYEDFELTRTDNKD